MTHYTVVHLVKQGVSRSKFSVFHHSFQIYANGRTTYQIFKTREAAEKAVAEYNETQPQRGVAFGA